MRQTANFVHQFGGVPVRDSECEAGGLDVLWGRNFVADAELVAVVADVNGRVLPHHYDSNAVTLFIGSSVQAAMFALGTLGSLPSVEEFVVPRINGVYYAFMLLPLCVAVVLALLTYSMRSKRLDVPVNAWQLMVLSKEQDAISARLESERENREYPKEDKTLVLKLSQESKGDLVVASDHGFSCHKCLSSLLTF